MSWKGEIEFFKLAIYNYNNLATNLLIALPLIYCIVPMTLFYFTATCMWVKVKAIHPTREENILTREGEPARRYGHTCVSYGNKIFMYGGYNNNDGLLGEMECFDVTHSMWLKMHPTAKGCELPSAKFGHACTTNGRIMFMHGGTVEGRVESF